VYDNSGRNKYWHNIVKSCGYTYEILCKGLTDEQARELEIILIEFYGRYDLGLGPLVNMTNGGDGGSGFVYTKERLETKNTPEAIAEFIKRMHSPEANLKRLANMDYKARSEKTDYSYLKTPESIATRTSVEVLKKRSDTCRKPDVAARRVANTDFQAIAAINKQPVLQYTLEGILIKEWAGASDAAKELKIKARGISKGCYANNSQYKGFIWRFKDPSKWKPPVRDKAKSRSDQALKISKPIIQYSLSGDFIKEWSSAMEVYRSLGITNSSIGSVCNNKNGKKTAGGFIWKFKKD
jgi:hypothetical protein